MTVLQWSDLARNPREIAEIVDRDGEARIERRGNEQLVLLASRRYDAAVEHLETLSSPMPKRGEREVTAGGRIWFCPDPKTRTVWITYASPKHPKATE